MLTPSLSQGSLSFPWFLPCLLQPSPTTSDGSTNRPVGFMLLHAGCVSLASVWRQAVRNCCSCCCFRLCRCLTHAEHLAVVHTPVAVDVPQHTEHHSEESWWGHFLKAVLANVKLEIISQSAEILVTLYLFCEQVRWCWIHWRRKLHFPSVHSLKTKTVPSFRASMFTASRTPISDKQNT